jgi:TRAP-type mannitol/chloroaromatic compound transport system substrate-binding protein
LTTVREFGYEGKRKVHIYYNTKNENALPKEIGKVLSKTTFIFVHNILMQQQHERPSMAMTWVSGVGPPRLHSFRRVNEAN